MPKSQHVSGFTLLEVVIVIALLAILATMAMPRMVSNYDDAHFSTVAATGGALSSAVMLVRTQWVASGENKAVDVVRGFGLNNVASTASGWPSDADKGAASNHSPVLNGEVQRCIRLWNALLSTHGLSVSEVASDSPSYSVEIKGQSVCVYVYQSGGFNSRIEYDLSQGLVHTFLQ